MFSHISVPSADSVILSGKFWKSNAVSTSPVVVFIHQYAVMGGQSNLMDGMAQIACKSGYDAITFDLRGAGKSSGSSSYTNFAEQQDVKAILDYVINETTSNIVLLGSSAGAPLAGSVLDYSDRIIGGAFIGYVWGWWGSWLFGWAYKPIKPKLFIVSDVDEFTSLSTYHSKMKCLKGAHEMKVIEGKNHFEIESAAYDAQVIAWLDEFARQYGLFDGNKQCDK